VPAPQDLLDRIRLRLEESFVGIGEVVGDMPPADLADLVNELTLQEAASVMTMLAVPRAIEVFDQPKSISWLAVVSVADTQPMKAYSQRPADGSH
jgi:Mg/Co/Ni transporter MgtE